MLWDPTERAWQNEVIRLAVRGRWRHHHQEIARRSVKGWPDLVLVRPPELVIAELKTERGKLSDEQVEWLRLLGACGVEVYVWRPSDLAAVAARLLGPSTKPLRDATTNVT